MIDTADAAAEDGQGLDSYEDLQAAMTDPQATYVQIQARTTTGTWAYRGRVYVETVGRDLSELLEHVRKEQGGGEYQLRVMLQLQDGSSRYGKQRRVSIHGPPKREQLSAAEPRPALPPDDRPPERLRRRGPSKTDRLLRAVLMELRAGRQVAAPAPPPPALDALDMMSKMSDIMRNMRDAGGGGGGIGIKEMLGLIEFGAGRDAGAPPIGEWLPPLVQPLANLAAQELQMRRQPRMRRNPAEARAALPPGGGGRQPAQPATQAAPAPAERRRVAPPAWLQMAQPYIPHLVAEYTNQANPEDAAYNVLANAPGVWYHLIGADASTADFVPRTIALLTPAFPPGAETWLSLFVAQIASEFAAHDGDDPPVDDRPTDPPHAGPDGRSDPDGGD